MAPVEAIISAAAAGPAGPAAAALCILGAFILGASHAFEVDHMTAVSTFVTTTPKPRRAALFGLKWALGHGVSLLLFGSLLFALKLTLSDSVAHWFERTVGVALLLLGAWTLWKLRAKVPTHTHHGSFWMGILHGVAGTAAFVGETIVAVADGYLMVAAFTVAFSLGVLVAMSAYASVLGGLLSWTGEKSARAIRAIQALTAVGSCTVGAFWILR